ncbi:MAG: SpoIID/LytB domain-containing protein [candidate division Zixibacteria bacterium]|nr:SpoIID/LytB domain-containing protein [candidate division Zixibacteria bacterium]
MLLLGLWSAGGCIPARLRDGTLFAVDPVRPPVVRVRLPQNGTRMAVHGNGRLIVTACAGSMTSPCTISTQDPIGVHRTKRGFDVTGRRGIVLARGASGVAIYGTGSEDLLWLGDAPYHGALIIGRDDHQGTLVVNRLNLDAYLAGVVSPELGERTDDEFEAVKAQAVAARTYALTHLGQYGDAPYDLRADVGDQVYDGASRTRAWADEAVAATEGEILTYDGHLIDAYYHSTCGGHTDAIADVWPKPPRPYLISVDDSDFCQWSKYTHWTENFGARVLLANLRSYRRQLPDSPIGDFKSISDLILEGATPGGRVAAMTVVTSSGRWTIRADQIRWALGRPSHPGTILPSDIFTFSLRRDQHGRIIGATADGSGYGHGVGMCQCGMIGRARAGQPYAQILMTYYPGTTLEREY